MTLDAELDLGTLFTPEQLHHILRFQSDKRYCIGSDNAVAS